MLNEIEMENLNTVPEQENNFHWALRRIEVLSMGAKAAQLMEEIYWAKLFLLYWMEVKLNDFNSLQSSAPDISDVNEL